jgi:hypothetical protein
MYSSWRKLMALCHASCPIAESKAAAGASLLPKRQGPCQGAHAHCERRIFDATSGHRDCGKFRDFCDLGPAPERAA